MAAKLVDDYEVVVYLFTFQVLYLRTPLFPSYSGVLPPRFFLSPPLFPPSPYRSLATGPPAH